ncbi:restriction endonuclease subunit S [Aquihabitans sp. McL0605]|uniref:restriction endonuclease subunit S n=1 Tax=Aquihabitans sp. McL0605 TaxID=3415671 RepID=UPI003CED6791
MTVPTVALGDVASFLNGGTPSRARSDYFEGEIPWITGADISDEILVGDGARSHITAEAIRHSAANLVPAGTVLLVTRTGVGKAAIAGVALSYSQDITAVLPDAAHLDPRYLVRCLQDQAPRFKALAQGATIQGITRAVVEETEIPLLPIQQQQRIASLLDRADDLRSKRRSANELLRQLEDASCARFVAEQRDAPVLALAEVAERVTVGHVGQSSAHLDPLGVPFLRTGNVGDGRILRDNLLRISPSFHSTLRKSTLGTGDLVISRHVSRAVRAAVVPPELDGANCANIIVVRPGEFLSAEYLLALLRLPRTQRFLLGRQVGSAQSVVNTSTLKGWQIPVPQREALEEFDLRVAHVRSLGEAQASSLGELEALFASLQQRAFRGEL